MAAKTSQQIKSGTGQLGFCGVVRPIAAWDGCSPEHWADIQEIIAEACFETGYVARLVSEMTGASVIQAEIVNNLYSDPVIICDVSGRNPNVMFELGMRIAFQKPVIIVVDDATDFSFDISPLRHIIYRRDREYKSIVQFKVQLVEALHSVDKLTGYLSQFGDIHVTNIGDRTVSVDEIAKSLSAMVGQVNAIDRKVSGLIESKVIERNRISHLSASNALKGIPAGSLISNDMIVALREQLDANKISDEAARALAQTSRQIAKGVDPLGLKND